MGALLVVVAGGFELIHAIEPVMDSYDDFQLVHILFQFALSVLIHVFMESQSWSLLHDP